MKKLKKVLYEIVVLILPVMLGVYLGLLANNWNNEKELNNLTQIISKSLTSL